MRKESVNYKFKYSFNSWIIFFVGRMSLVGTDEIKKIKLEVCDTE